MKTIEPLKKAEPLLVTPDELAEFATRRYGPEWRVQLARELYVDARTVYRWEHHISAIPGPVRAWMDATTRTRKRKAS